MKRQSAVVSFFLLSLFAAAPLRADVEEGIRLLRAARQSLDQGDSGAALTLLDQAYIELPFSVEEDLVYHGRADAYAAEGRYAEALDQYRKAMLRPSAHRARFNSGVLQSRLAEQALQEAGVPLDPAGIPAEADPAPLIEAIEQNMPLLKESRLQFMEALRLQPDAAGRESASALTERLDDLNEMLDELQQREQDQQDNEDEGDDENKDDKDDKDDEESEDKQDQDQDQDSPNKDEPSDEEESPPPDEEPPPAQPQEQLQAQPRPELTAAELAELLDQLEELEAKAMEMDRQRRAQAQADVEKDW